MKASCAGLAGGVGLALLRSAWREDRADKLDDLIESVDTSIIFRGRETGHTWAQARVGVFPANDGRRRLFMTMQRQSGSDFYGPVYFTISDDGGKTWSEPQPVPGLRQTPVEGDLRVGVCDPVPEYHPQTRTILVMGHTVFYRGNGYRNEDQRMRNTVYVVRKADGSWSPMRLLEWKDSPKTGICTTNCSQRVTLDNGDVLIPLSFGEAGVARDATTVRCSFDGDKLTVLKAGNRLKNGAGRGLLEPSLVRHGDRFYMTIRAEDNRGYVSVSSDGLTWEKQRPWCWQNGEPLMLSSTQQRWLPHSDGPYLVYTRRAENNVNVMRWRAPLFAARVDLASLTLVRETERVIFPLDGDGVADGKRVPGLGNFHTTMFSPEESFISNYEAFPANGWKGNTLLARVRWKVPNRLAAR